VEDGSRLRLGEKTQPSGKGHIWASKKVVLKGNETISKENQENIAMGLGRDLTPGTWVERRQETPFQREVRGLTRVLKGYVGKGVRRRKSCSGQVETKCSRRDKILNRT